MFALVNITTSPETAKTYIKMNKINVSLYVNLQTSKSLYKTALKGCKALIQELGRKSSKTLFHEMYPNYFRGVIRMLLKRLSNVSRTLSWELKNNFITTFLCNITPLGFL